jgi:ABC-type branched-subunit amino acid transport system substrate-binding protein
MARGRVRIAGALAALTLVAAACGDDDDSGGDAATEDTADAATAATAASEETAAATASTAAESAGTSGDTADTATDTAGADTTAASGTEGTDDTGTADGAGAHGPGTLLGDNGRSGSDWTVNTDDCVDPDAANEPIEGTVRLGASMPLSGGPAATAYAPFADGLNAYVTYANENELVPGYEIELSIGDDQFNPALTPDVVNGLLDEGVHAFTGIIGSGPNLAVRQLLNDECVPQMFAQSGIAEWGEVESAPWSFGNLIPYDIEGAAYAQEITNLVGEGATAMTYYVNIEFGQSLADGFVQGAEEQGIDVLGSQTIEATETGPPTAQVQAIAAEQPDAIMAVPLGAQCPVFLSELANAKAANPGWEPVVFITNTCASKEILGAAGAAAQDVYSSASAGLRDPDDPDEQEVPAVQTYIEAMQAGGYPASSISVGAAGWNVMETTVEILRQAAESPDGLTRAAIINAARNLHYHSSMTREGVEYKMSGEDDGWYVEDVQIVQYDAESSTFEEIGELITDFRFS